MERREDVLPSTSKRASGVLPFGVIVEREFVFEIEEAVIGTASSVGFVDAGAAWTWSARRCTEARLAEPDCEDDAGKL